MGGRAGFEVHDTPDLEGVQYMSGLTITAAPFR